MRFSSLFIVFLSVLLSVNLIVPVFSREFHVPEWAQDIEVDGKPAEFIQRHQGFAYGEPMDTSLRSSPHPTYQSPSFEPSPSSTSAPSPASGQFMIGVGMADVTGPAAEIGFMGYAQPSQKAGGLHIRLRSRAFIFGELSNPNQRVVYLSIDICMGFQLVKDRVVERLQAKYGSVYRHENIILSGTHTHSGPGGFGGTALVDITTLGFIPENFEAIVSGIVLSIVRAHESFQPGNIKINSGMVYNASANRSPSAYLLNPDRSGYQDNTDKEMTVLRLEAANGQELGAIAFFAVHGTSLNNTNPLVSGDNKGLASLYFEKFKNPTSLPGTGAFVAAFGQANEGDNSPNTEGAFCPNGTRCDFVHSTCNHRNELCIAKGPGNDMYESVEIIGRRQYEAALKLYESATMSFSNFTIDFRHQYFNMQQINVSAEFTSTGQPGITCQAALGYGFAAGTTDGPGDFDFVQGTTHSNPFWSWVAGFLAKPTPEQIACQAPKPILIDSGLTKPLEWSAYILPEQLVRIGNLWIMAVPGEFTTMSGRRMKATVQQRLQAAGLWFPDSRIVVAGLSNAYSHYIATYEEFQQQRYEAASTLYGPHTLAAHQQNFASLVDAMIDNQPVPVGPLPIDMRNHTFSFMPGVIVDTPPSGQQFGSFNQNPASSYNCGEKVTVSYWCANLRNSLFTESSFFFIQLATNSSNWETRYVDGSAETKFYWKRSGLSNSLCTIEWNIPSDVEAGTYVILAQGIAKQLGGKMVPFSTKSNTFTVSANNCPLSDQ